VNTSKIFYMTAYLLFLMGLIEAITKIETEPLRLIATGLCCLGLLITDELRRGKAPAPPPTPAGKPREEE
jgi:hypothetical protein